MDWLGELLKSEEFSSCRLCVAFAKSGALERLAPAFRAFRKNAGTVEAVFGIDLRGTSRQALEFGLAEFDSCRIWHHPSALTTFHPKVWLFEGAARAVSIVGSNNLTVGGTETNSEACVRVDYALPSEAIGWTEASSFWAKLVKHPNSAEVSKSTIDTLAAQGLLFDEDASATPKGVGLLAKLKAGPAASLFPPSPLKPPSPAPRAHSKKPSQSGQPVPAKNLIAQALVIQIVPHHNGEIFLSKLAINENPIFFGFPFGGKTVPKKNNPPYPQRVPDPVTHWTVYSVDGKVIRTLPQFPLNTVFYDKKGEIRITVPPDVAKAIAPLSILHMTLAMPGSGLDYVCDVYPPTSLQHAALLAACTKTMPSGGGTKPRRFGWV